MRLNLKVKLTAVFVVLIGRSAGQTLVAIQNLAGARADLDRLPSQEVKGVSLAQSLAQAALEAQLKVREYLLAQSADARQAARQKLLEYRTQHDGVWPELHEIAAEKAQKELDTYQDPLGRLWDINNESTSAPQELSSTAGQLSGQADTLRAAVALFRTGQETAEAVATAEARPPRIEAPRPGRKLGGGGSALDMSASEDQLDAQFVRARRAA